MSTPEPYELYAIRYAHHDRRASENFIGGDPHDGPMPLDYFVWAIVERAAHLHFRHRLRRRDGREAQARIAAQSRRRA